MNDDQWRSLLTHARNQLGHGESISWASESWCAWTTFSSLEHHLTYWACGLPEVQELQEHGICDGGTWGQPFVYSDLAHLIIPAKFYWERFDENNGFQQGYKLQKIKQLSNALQGEGIEHRLTDLVLEVKLY